MPVSFSGDWGRIDRTLSGVARNLKSETSRAIGRGLKKVERKVLSHIDEQDLEWQKLSDAYAERKKDKGLSPDILRASNAMYQSITTDQPNAWEGMVGVKRGVKDANGEEVTDIALIHEQLEDDGTIIPARKLWAPTFEEVKDELAAELKGTAIKVLKR
jgi:hypothetical protein